MGRDVEVRARVDSVCRRRLCGGNDLDGCLGLRCKLLVLNRDLQPRAQRCLLIKALRSRWSSGGGGHHGLLGRSGRRLCKQRFGEAFKSSRVESTGAKELVQVGDLPQFRVAGAAVKVRRQRSGKGSPRFREESKEVGLLRLR